MKSKTSNGNYSKLFTYMIMFMVMFVGAVKSEEVINEISVLSISKKPVEHIAMMLQPENRTYQQAYLDKENLKEQSRWAFYMDNDVFVPGNRDRDYTGGMSLTLTGNKTKDYWYSANALLRAMDAKWNLEKNYGRKVHSIELGLTAFTPDNTESKEVIKNDRPYSSLLYISNTREQINASKRQSTITTLTLGMLGLQIAEEVQNNLHQVVAAKKTEGWGNQISQGGEFTFRYGVASQKIRSSRYLSDSMDYEVASTAKMSVGYLTDMAWGMSARLGRLNSPWWSFKPQLNEYSEKSSGQANKKYSTDEFYLWTGFNIRLRAYNALLQGQFKDSKHSYNRNELKYVLGEIWLGVTRELSNGLRLSYFVRAQTSEIKHGSGSRNPVWGGLIISQLL